MIGYRFSKYIPPKDTRSPFEKLLQIFLELLTYTSGDVEEAVNWLRQIDEEHKLTTKDYTIDDFLKDLEEQAYIKGDKGTGRFDITAKAERGIRRSALEEIFGKLKKQQVGNHRTPYSGKGDELTSDIRKYQFGDDLSQISMTASLRNAQVRGGLDNFSLTEDDLEVRQDKYKTQLATVLMIDISHSMILYGEDRITPAKKVAMALAELITTKYPKDKLEIIVFGNDAWQIQIRDLPYLTVGPYHTNTVAGLELAMDLLRRKKTENKQIFMITDGKPSCLLINNRYYKNSFGLDEKIMNATLDLARKCRSAKIPITTFMIASDPYLQKFVQEFTEVNHGKAFYSDLEDLGAFIFEDYERNRRKRIR